MFESVHAQPLKLRLLSASNDFDVVAAPQAMVEDAQQAINDADHSALACELSQ
jgi:hypothetical protein